MLRRSVVGPGVAACLPDCAAGAKRDDKLRQKQSAQVSAGVQARMGKRTPATGLPNRKRMKQHLN